jgi:hypothetical protein
VKIVARRHPRRGVGGEGPTNQFNNFQSFKFSVAALFQPFLLQTPRAKDLRIVIEQTRAQFLRSAFAREEELRA